MKREKNLGKTDVLVVGAGLCGSVVARELAEKGRHVVIWERRGHIGGNMYDYRDAHGILVQKYGPHAFHTVRKDLYEYICRYEAWTEYRLLCGAVWDGVYTPTPFNFTTIDRFYPAEKGKILKAKLEKEFRQRKTAAVTEVLEHKDKDIREYAEFLFRNDYAPYTAKQWGITPDQIDPSVLERVPLRFSYEEGYFDDAYQAMPVHSFSDFFRNLLDHENIHVEANVDALEHLQIVDDHIWIDGKPAGLDVVYTGALDELFRFAYGKLPYRSLRFEMRWEDKESLQPVSIVAYPKEEGYTRITEFKKLPFQDVEGTSYAVEFPVPYQPGTDVEPYYPVLTEESRKQFQRYSELKVRVEHLYCCGRLADFKYYNMDQALGAALELAGEMIGR